MIVGFSEFLKQVGCFMRFFRLCTSPNVDIVSSLTSQLKFHRIIIISYCGGSESISFSMSLTLFRMGGGDQKGLPTSFSPVTSTIVEIRPQNFQTFNFNPFATLA